MSDALARLRAYSEQILAKGPKSFEVPELADPSTGAALRVYVLPMTAREKAAILRPLDEGDMMGMAIQTIINRARDEHGRPLFVPEDIEAFLEMRLDDVLERVAIQIGSLWANVTVEEARGN